jgi:hypothetical protein
MIWRIGAWLLAILALAGVVALAAVALTPHDHKVELVVDYPHSRPDAVWRLLTDHASEPRWLPPFGSVERQPDRVGLPVWTHRSPDGSFTATIETIAAIPERYYERLLLRDGQPPDQPWDGRWVFELEPVEQGTRLKITEYGWTGGFLFFVRQRFVGSPHDFLQYYAARIGQRLNDPARIEILRRH